MEHWMDWSKASMMEAVKEPMMDNKWADEITLLTVRHWE